MDNRRRRAQLKQLRKTNQPELKHVSFFVLHLPLIWYSHDRHDPSTACVYCIPSSPTYMLPNISHSKGSLYDLLKACVWWKAPSIPHNKFLCILVFALDVATIINIYLTFQLYLLYLYCIFPIFITQMIRWHHVYVVHPHIPTTAICVLVIAYCVLRVTCHLCFLYWIGIFGISIVFVLNFQG